MVVPLSRIQRLDAFTIEVPQNAPVAPYRSRYVSTCSTGALLVRIVSDQGLVGWGEAPQVMAFHGAEPLTAKIVESLRPQLVGLDVDSIDRIYDELELGGDRIQSAVEMAIWDLIGKERSLPVWTLLGKQQRRWVEVAACMGIESPREAANKAEQYLRAGFQTLKIKGGRSPSEDIAIVRSIRDAVGHDLALRLDPNTAYDFETAFELAKALEPFKLQYLEQPMAESAIAESARLRKLTSTPLALNESVTSFQSVEKILDVAAAEVLLPDTQQCGGIRAVKRIVDHAAAANVECVFHCAHDFGLKTAAMLQVTACSPNMRLANDTTYYGLVSDIIRERFRITAGRMRIPTAPGLGVTVDPELVQRYVRTSSVDPREIP